VVSTEIPANWSDVRHPHFERNISAVKVIMGGARDFMSIQQKVDEAVLKMQALDNWPKLLARWEEAKKEAASLRASLAARRLSSDQP
jgi:hypothetical protein